MMFFYESSEFIGLLFKAIAVLFFTGIVVIPFVPARIKPLVSIFSVFFIGFITSVLAIRAISTGNLEYIINGGSFFGQIPLRMDGLTAWFVLIINFTCFSGVSVWSWLS